MLAAESRLGLEFLTANALEPEQVADIVLEGIRQEKFLILPHPRWPSTFKRKATDYDRWLNGMRRMRKRVLAASSWWLAGSQPLRGLALVAIAFIAASNVADTREGLIAEVVTLFSGLVGVLLLLYGLVPKRAAGARDAAPPAPSELGPGPRSANDLLCSAPSGSAGGRSAHRARDERWLAVGRDRCAAPAADDRRLRLPVRGIHGGARARLDDQLETAHRPLRPISPRVRGRGRGAARRG